MRTTTTSDPSALLADWCSATGRDPALLTPADLDAFAAQVRGPAVRQALRAHRGPGQATAAPDPATAPAWPATGPDLPTVLARIGSPGWPQAFRARRDAWLLVLLAPRAQGGVGLTRDQARLLAPDRVGVSGRAPGGGNDGGAVGVHVGGEWVRVGVAPDRSGCPACACLAWLDVAADAHAWTRASVRARLSSPEAGQEAGRGHRCDPVGQTASETGRFVPLAVADYGHHLAPAIDRHGWHADWRPMSARAVTTVLALRCGADAQVPRKPGLPPEPKSRRDPGLAGLTRSALFGALDEAARAADAVNDRVAALLDDTEATLRRLRPARDRQPTGPERAASQAC